MSAVDKYIVAVVDDDPRILESLESLLTSAGHAVRLFPSAEACLENDDLAKIDCLISDIGMPGIDGFELQRLVKMARPDLPVILITGRHDVTDHIGAMSQESRVLFRKPFNVRDLLAAVAASLQGSARVK
jgi:FixJ family two-component response regulator